MLCSNTMTGKQIMLALRILHVCKVTKLLYTHTLMVHIHTEGTSPCRWRAVESPPPAMSKTSWANLARMWGLCTSWELLINFGCLLSQTVMFSTHPINMVQKVMKWVCRCDERANVSISECLYYTKLSYQLVSLPCSHMLLSSFKRSLKTSRRKLCTLYMYHTCTLIATCILPQECGKVGHVVYQTFRAVFQFWWDLHGTCTWTMAVSYTHLTLPTIYSV